ncbi:MAG: hypothetical protein J6W54_04085 [Fibrobacter sp.]|uniref:hypothetical protein n=1 Tax=Fibrobacter sp. TaxID=35828 RepID=UPI001B018894|nr:hypothetical protein [Fibrobacter sp.]MBO7060260.1 hypothetical protein [Fibrobacter sp.]
MENEFLHKVNLDSLQKETGLSLQGIADLAEVSVQTVYRWAWDKARQGNRPSYNAFVRLFEKGASVKSLFGVERKEQSVPAEVAGNPEFLAGVEHALSDMKARGIIREEVEQAIAEMKAKGQL